MTSALPKDGIMINPKRDPYLLPSRMKEIERVANEIAIGGKTIAYVGLHDMGKKLFADQLVKALEGKVRVVNVSVCEGEEIKWTFYDICKQLRDYGVELDDDIMQDAPDPIYGYITMMQDGLRNRKDKNPIVLILTDFDKCGPGCRSLLDRFLEIFDNPTAYLISIVIFMTRTLEMLLNRETARPTHSPGRFYQENRRAIQPYKELEVMKWCKDVGFGDKDCRMVWQFSQGHPYLMKRAAEVYREKHGKEWVDSLEKDEEVGKYHRRIEEFLGKVGVDSARNEKVHTLLDAVVRKRHLEEISETATSFLRDYGLLANDCIICPDAFWKVLEQDGKLSPGKPALQPIEKATNEDGDADLQHRERGRSSFPDGQVTPAFRISDQGNVIKANGESFRITRAATWSFLDKLLKAARTSDKWVSCNGNELTVFNSTQLARRFREIWIETNCDAGSKAIRRARLRTCPITPRR